MCFCRLSSAGLSSDGTSKIFEKSKKYFSLKRVQMTQIVLIWRETPIPGIRNPFFYDPPGDVFFAAYLRMGLRIFPIKNFFPSKNGRKRVEKVKSEERIFSGDRISGAYLRLAWLRMGHFVKAFIFLSSDGTLAKHWFLLIFGWLIFGWLDSGWLVSGWDTCENVDLSSDGLSSAGLTSDGYLRLAWLRVTIFGWLDSGWLISGWLDSSAYWYVLEWKNWISKFLSGLVCQ